MVSAKKFVSMGAEKWKAKQSTSFKRMFRKFSQRPEDKILLDLAYRMGFSDGMIYAVKRRRERSANGIASQPPGK